MGGTNLHFEVSDELNRIVEAIARTAKTNVGADGADVVAIVEVTSSTVRVTVGTGVTVRTTRVAVRRPVTWRNQTDGVIEGSHCWGTPVGCTVAYWSSPNDKTLVGLSREESI